jgi:hypothetical protein
MILFMSKFKKNLDLDFKYLIYFFLIKSMNHSENSKPYDLSLSNGIFGMFLTAAL